MAIAIAAGRSRVERGQAVDGPLRVNRGGVRHAGLEQLGAAALGRRIVGEGRRQDAAREEHGEAAVQEGGHGRFL